MTLNEVPKSIINSPNKEPVCHWHIEKGKPPVQQDCENQLGDII